MPLPEFKNKPCPKCSKVEGSVPNLPRVMEAEEVKKVLCPGCGDEPRPDDKFCTACGTPLKAEGLTYEI